MNSEQAVPSYSRICKQCGSITKTADSLPGNGWIEVVLWLCYLVPGLIYSIWRRTKKNLACSSCGSREIVGVTTPVGRQLLSEHHNHTKVVASSATAPPSSSKNGPSALRIVAALFIVLLLVFAAAFIVGQVNRLSA